MNRLDYKKGMSAELDRDFEEAAPYAKVKVGQKNLYWRGFLRWSYMPMEEVTRIYRRIEEVKGRTGCCSNDFSVHKLIVENRDGESMEVLIGESLYRQEPERLMEKLKEIHPQITYKMKEA